MSRLWPETVAVGLFPGLCWLRRRRGAAAQEFRFEAAADPYALLPALEATLEEQAKTLRKGTRVAVTVSDSAAAIAMIPWQDALHRQEELQAYAKVFFERNGVAIGDDWVLHVEFRQYGAAGLAYAVPLKWLTRLVDMLKTKGLRLAGVLPATAASYCRPRPASKEGRTLIILREAFHDSALVYGKEGLLGYDVEPVVGAARESCARLLKRVGARHEGIKNVFHWSPEAPEAAPSASIIADCLPGAAAHLLARDAWSH
ncbi:MAG TPA: hypothetical protein VEC06_03795 [Paucimonas sp.]|nr:hypothetical protein [Paucimonas sp.]